MLGMHENSSKKIVSVVCYMLPDCIKIEAGYSQIYSLCRFQHQPIKLYLPESRSFSHYFVTISISSWTCTIISVEVAKKTFQIIRIASQSDDENITRSNICTLLQAMFLNRKQKVEWDDYTHTWLMGLHSKSTISPQSVCVYQCLNMHALLLIPLYSSAIQQVILDQLCYICNKQISIMFEHVRFKGRYTPRHCDINNNCA